MKSYKTLTIQFSRQQLASPLFSRVLSAITALYRLGSLAILWAKAKAGELLKDRGSPVRTSDGRFMGRETLPEGITKKQSHYYQMLADNKNVQKEKT